MTLYENRELASTGRCSVDYISGAECPPALEVIAVRVVVLDGDRPDRGLHYEVYVYSFRHHAM